MVDQDQDIEIEGTVIKKSKIISFLEKFIVNPIKETFTKSEDSKKTEYADCIIRNMKGEVLLLQRSYQSKFMPGTWCLPGGHVDEGEDIGAAGIRELKEETGIDAIDFTFVDKIERPDSNSYYFQGLFEGNITNIVLDNSEHYRYEFVAFENLDRYDLILDLGKVLDELKDQLNPILLIQEEFSNPLEALAATGSMSLHPTVEIISKAFDDGLINEEDYTRFIKINSAVETITKAFDEGLCSEEDFVNAIQKSKHYEFVKVVRDGKQFFQYREVGTDKIEDELPTGDSFSANDLGLTITKYSDKSFLITGNTYKNLELLREIKKEIGLGVWNKALDGWVFPVSGKDKMLSLLASKMTVETYDEQVERDNVIALKNALEVGSTVVIAGGLGVEVKEVTAVDGKVKYTTEGQMEDDQDVKSSEEEVGIPEPEQTKVEELIDNVTEENRMKTTKQIVGKQGGQKSVSKDIETLGISNTKIELKDFTTRSGEVVNALDFTNIRQDLIQLPDIENILDKPRPLYIPEINEYAFSGRDDKFIFDYVKMGDGNFLVSLNGEKDGTIFNSNPRYKKVDNAYAVMSLDNLVALTEYYKTKRKAEIKKEVEDLNISYLDKIKNFTPELLERYKPFSYTRLSSAQTKKYTQQQWEALSIEEKLKEVPKMSRPVYSFKGQKRIKVLEDDSMLRSNFDMYKKFVDKSYKTPFDLGSRRYSSTDPCAIEFSEAREQIKWKALDLSIQKEDNDSTYQKGRETSYGDSGTKDFLLESHGVKVKSQNGKEISPGQVEQIRENLDKVYNSFGDRSAMAKNFGLKISHSGEKLMHARKALGLYLPSMNAIGVSNDPEMGKFGFTLAHEFAHFIDNYAGKKSGRNYASDDFNSTAGIIASTFRKNMNATSESNYINRTCECFARAMEQYHAMKAEGEDAIKYKIMGVKYHEDSHHVSKEKFNEKIKPLIETFLQENDHLLKSILSSQIADASASFELIKAAFDQGQIDEGSYLEYLQKYNELQKADPSHGGKLEKVTLIDKNGKKEVKWMSKEEAKTSENTMGEKTKHTYEKLHEFAKDTPEKELKRIINESHDEKLRKAAHKELDRRKNKEAALPKKKQDDKVSKVVNKNGELNDDDGDSENLQVGETINCKNGQSLTVIDLKNGKLYYKIDGNKATKNVELNYVSKYLNSGWWFKNKEKDDAGAGKIMSVNKDGKLTENKDSEEKDIMTITNPGEALKKIKEFFKDDSLINRTIDFIEPILASNKKIQIDTKYKFDNGVLGLSFPNGKIAVNYDAMKGDNDLLYRTMLHEMVHAATRNEIKTNPAFREDLTDILSNIRTALKVPDNDSIISLFHSKGIIDDNLYGASNEYEMVAEIFTNQKFYNYLAGIQYKGDSILKKIFTLIAKCFSQKYRQVSEVKEKVSAENSADYLMQLTQSVVNNSKFINYNSTK